jgi:hypothetical protein
VPSLVVELNPLAGHATPAEPGTSPGG